MAAHKCGRTCSATRVILRGLLASEVPVAAEAEVEAEKEAAKVVQAVVALRLLKLLRSFEIIQLTQRVAEAHFVRQQHRRTRRLLLLLLTGPVQQVRHIFVCAEIRLHQALGQALVPVPSRK